ncbi:MAG TPA: hypothetical protein G4O00_14545 [Thermoflexia bacterium]|nr:hypothetical protein [Thermoflexia bacterium]
MYRTAKALILAGVVLSLLACRITVPEIPSIPTIPAIPSLPSIPRVTPGPMERYEEDIPRDGATEARVRIRLGAGEIYLSAGEVDPLFHGIFRTNIASWAPEVTWSNGILRIEQGAQEGIPDPGAKNEWDLSFSPEVALDVDAEIGAARGELNFTGLRLQRLFLEVGASDLRIRFDEPNPEPMSDLIIQTGASNLRVDSIGNAGPERVQVEGGVGNLILDLRGAWPQSAWVEIEAGVGALTLYLPEEIGVRVEVRGSLSNVSADEGLHQSDGVYTNAAYGQTDRQLDITLSVGVGRVELKVEE